MPKTIEIPTYRILIPNSAYGRNTEPVKHPMSGEKVPATQILQLGRYTIPSEDDIINQIQSAARNYNPLSTAENTLIMQEIPIQEVPLDEFVKRFSPDEIKKIQDGRKDIMSHLRKHCPNYAGQAGKAYLEVGNGVIPDEVLNSADEAIREKGDIIYTWLIDKIGIKEWHLRIRLNGKDCLPNSSELEYFLDRKTENCDIFKVNGDYGDYQAVAAQLRLLRDVLGSSAEMRKIIDRSDFILKLTAAKTIEKTAVCIAAKKTLESLASGLIGIITGAIGEQEKPKRDKPFGLWGDCRFSLN